MPSGCLTPSGTNSSLSSSVATFTKSKLLGAEVSRDDGNHLLEPGGLNVRSGVGMTESHRMTAPERAPVRDTGAWLLAAGGLAA